MTLLRSSIISSQNREDDMNYLIYDFATFFIERLSLSDPFQVSLGIICKMIGMEKLGFILIGFSVN